MYDFQRVGWALNPMLCSTFYILKKTSYTEALNGQTSTISYFYNIPYVCIRIILNLCFVLRGYLCPAYTHVHTSSLSKIIILNLHCSAPFHRHYVYLISYMIKHSISLSRYKIYIYMYFDTRWNQKALHLNFESVAFFPRISFARIFTSF